MEPQPQQNGVSKKTFGAGIAISSMAGIDCENPLVKIGAIVIVAVTAITVQGFLDWQKPKPKKTSTVHIPNKTPPK